MVGVGKERFNSIADFKPTRKVVFFSTSKRELLLKYKAEDTVENIQRECFTAGWGHSLFSMVHGDNVPWI